MANRHTLHLKHLEEFTNWLIANGWEIEKTKGYYQILVARKSNRKQPLILYSKLQIKEHLTVRDIDMPVVRAFFRDKRKVVRNESRQST
jgi:hypothetical protein